MVNIINWIKAKLGTKDEFAAYKAELDQLAMEERLNQRKETMVYKEKMKGEAERKRIKASYNRKPVNILDSLVGSAPKQAKGRAYVSKPYNPPNINDFKLEMPKLKF